MFRRMMTNKEEGSHWLLQIPFTVWVIGCCTLLMNLSSVMIFSLTPIYLTQVFGMAAFHLGILEGIVEFCSWMTRMFSGVLSDSMRRRKPVLTFAYLLTFLARPIFALAPTIVWIYVAKLTDRIANGVQASPREALVGDVAPAKMRGACYGLRQSLGLVGSICGAVGVMVLMRLTANNYSLIFLFAAIPTFLALMTLTFCVKDVEAEAPQKRGNAALSFMHQLKKIPQLGMAFWCITFVSGVFMISNSSGAYRILQAERLGFPVEDVSVLMIVQNLGAMLAAFPIGRLSDRIDRRFLLGAGFCATIASNFFFGGVGGTYGMIIGSALWGMQMGVTQSLFLAFVAGSTPKDLRGTAFGVYYFQVAFSLFIANITMGWLFDLYGATTAFVFSGAIAFLAILLLPLLQSPSKSAVPA